MEEFKLALKKAADAWFSGYITTDELIDIHNELFDAWLLSYLSLNAKA